MLRRFFNRRFHEAGGVVTIAPLSPLMDRDTTDPWHDLERRAGWPSPYLSPGFVAPAMRELTPGARVYLASCREADRRTARWTGLALVTTAWPTRHAPAPHLQLFSTRHTFVNGLLLDRDAAPAALDAMLQALRRCLGGQLLLWLPDLQADSPLGQLLPRLEGGFRWFEVERFQRPVLRPAAAGEDYLKAHLSRKRRKKLRGAWNRLSRQGRLERRIVRGAVDVSPHVETFMRLEHLGWKGENGSSLLSRPQDARFFREMMTDLAARSQALFAELLLDGEVIASTSNLTAGSAGFAFKVAWEPALARFGPGMMNELQMIRHGPQELGDLTLFDSGTRPGSFIEALWKERTPIISGFVTAGCVPAGLVRAAARLRALKQAVQARRGS